MFLRLRQLCLVARELEPVVDDLCAVFGLQVGHRDPAVERFGLHNALLRIGPRFVEVVAPLRDGTAAGRHLQRRGGDGGYMVILDSDDIAPWQQHVATLGVRVAALLEAPGYTGLQLHPRDTGGALLEINHSPGNADLGGPYWPAGAHWQQAPQGNHVRAIAAAVLQADAPSELAARWSRILQRPLDAATPPSITLDDGAQLRFVGATDGRGDGLSAVDLQVVDAAPIVAAARARGCAVDQAGGVSSVQVGGVRWRLAAR